MTEPTPRSVIVTDALEMLTPAIERLSADGVEVEVVEDGTSHEELIERASARPVIITAVTTYGAAEIASLAATRLIVRAGIGYDTIDVAAATDAGILVANVPDFCIDEVADHTIALLLAAVRRLPETLSIWRQTSGWHGMVALPPIHRLRGQRLGLIGVGRIGRAVATRARSFGLNVVGYDPFLSHAAVPDIDIELLELDELLATSDIVSLHCPLTDDTRHLIDSAGIAAMKPGAVLVNAGRGGLVDLDALAAGVGSGHVRGAALDVLDGEPDPNLQHPLLSMPNVLLTPHVAWYSIEARRELALKTAQEALRFIDVGRVENPVNPQVFQRS